MTSVVDEGVQLSRFTSVNVAAFAIAALLLMAAGVYGLVSFTASSRTREIGLRIALGARPEQIRRLVARQSAVLGGIGLILGLGVSWPLTTQLGTQLFGVEPHDPMTIVAVAGVMALAVTAATLGPAHRASRTDPAVALRQQ
jgi:ABC-type antimicrobial peptide transport system permease subunit